MSKNNAKHLIITEENGKEYGFKHPNATDDNCRSLIGNTGAMGSAVTQVSYEETYRVMGATFSGLKTFK